MRRCWSWRIPGVWKKDILYLEKIFSKISVFYAECFKRLVRPIRILCQIFYTIFMIFSDLFIKGSKIFNKRNERVNVLWKKIIFQKITLMVLDKFFWKISIILETKIDSNFFISTNWVNFIYYMKCLSFNKTVSFKRRKYKPYIPYIIS